MRLTHAERWLRRVLIAAVGFTLAVAGCRSAPRASEEPRASSAEREPEREAAPSAAPPPVAKAPARERIVCGAGHCRGDQLCVHPCCGGAGPLCVPRLADGRCPPQSEPMTGCPGMPEGGCKAKPCVPDPPRCVDRPSLCEGAASCGCLPPGVCGAAGGCMNVAASEVYCGCA